MLACTFGDCREGQLSHGKHALALMLSQLYLLYDEVDDNFGEVRYLYFLTFYHFLLFAYLNATYVWLTY